MKTEIEFDRYGMTSEEVARFVGEVVETLVLRNIQYLHNHPRLRLFDAKIRYAESLVWRDVPHVLKNGCGDCKSIVPWRLAELRSLGEDALVQVVVLDEARLFHLQVVREGGDVEDTCLLLGMNSRDNVVSLHARK